MTEPSKNERAFVPLNIAILTVSDTRTEETDTSGKALVERLTKAGHRLAEKATRLPTETTRPVARTVPLSSLRPRRYETFSSSVV